MNLIENIKFPNIRKLFIPDPGYLIVDTDLSGADAQIVAWETGEEELKDALRSGKKIHAMVAKELYGSSGQPYYDMTKRRIHATNYGGGAKKLHQTLAGQFGTEYTSLEQEKDFQSYWFDKYPGVKDWHNRIKRELDETCGVTNRFGYKITYQDRIDTVFNRALAWVPQSTVALLTSRGMLAIKDNFPMAEILMQVHDSIIFQIPIKHKKQLYDIKDMLNSLTVPYPDPLNIPWSVDFSTKSWGDVVCL